MKKSLFTAPVVIGQLAAVALFVQGCTTYTPGRTALGSSSTELPSGTVVKLGDQSPGSSATTVSPKLIPATPPPASKTATPDVPFTKFVIPEGKTVSSTPDGLKKTAIRHVPAPAPSAEAGTSPETLSSDGKYAVYVVKRGDTAGQIANRHGLTRAEFTRINSLANPDRILVGQKLKVPSGGKPLAAGPATSTSSPEEGVHVVVSGETLSEIAQKYSMRTADLVALNSISNPNVVRVGQKLKVSKTSAVSKVERKAASTSTPKEPKPSTTKAVETPSSGVAEDSGSEGDAMEALLGPYTEAPAATKAPSAAVVETKPAAPAAPKAAALKEHTVLEGEDIFSVAIAYGVRPMEIRRENNMTGSSLTPGSVIKIPSSDLGK